MAISMTGTQRTLVVTGIVIGCGAGVYALGTTQAHGATPAVAPATVTSTTAPGGTVSSGITVTGTGNATGTPDELQLSLEVDEHASSVGPALDAANQDMTKVRAALGAHGVADADLQTSGMSVQPDYGPQGNITGYQVTESLTAVLRNLGRAGDAITAADQSLAVRECRWPYARPGHQRHRDQQRPATDALGLGVQCCRSQVGGADLGRHSAGERLRHGDIRTRLTRTWSGVDAGGV
jgi:hypothetical protein